MFEKLLISIIPKAYAVIPRETDGPFPSGSEGNEITNPVVSKIFGSGAPNVAFANIIITVWRTAVTLGGLALLVMLIIGALEWITAGGEKSKIETARERITQSIVGLLVLIGTVAISIFVGQAFGIDLLRPQFAQNLPSGGTP